MTSDYTNTFFRGNVFFPEFDTGYLLSVGESGRVIPVEQPNFRSITFSQNTPSSSWQFTHNFGVVPSFILVYDEEGENITYGVAIDADEQSVSIGLNGNLVKGKVIAYSLGIAPEEKTEIIPRIVQEFAIEANITKDGVYPTFIQIAKSFQLLQLTCFTPIRFRAYISQNHQILDLPRNVNVMPTGDHGLIFEGITSPSQTTINLSPVALGYTLDDSSNVYIAITNFSSSAVQNLDFRLTYLRLEH